MRWPSGRNVAVIHAFLGVLCGQKNIEPDSPIASQFSFSPLACDALHKLLRVLRFFLRAFRAKVFAFLTPRLEEFLFHPETTSV
jgi:hypothetical protein